MIDGCGGIAFGNGFLGQTTKCYFSPLVPMTRMADFINTSKLSLDGIAKMKLPGRVKIANEITFLRKERGKWKEYVSTICLYLANG